MKKFSLKRAAYWLVFNGAFGALAYFAVIGNVGAGRLLTFCAVANCVLTLFISLCLLIDTKEGKELREKITEKGRAVPTWLAVGLDIAIAFTCVWQGWIFTGLVTLIQAFVEAILFAHKEATGKELS